MACPGSFHLVIQKNTHDPKSGRDLGPDKLGYIKTSCGGVTNPKLSHFLWILVPDPQPFKLTLESQSWL